MQVNPVEPQPVSSRPRLQNLRARLHHLYYGDSVGSLRFRSAWVIADLAIIGFFIVAPLIRDRPIFLIIDYAIAALLAIDLTARALAWGNFRDWLKRPSVLVDIFVLATLLFPYWLFNVGFLRVLRLWTLVHSEIFWRTVGRRYDDTRVEDIVRAVATMLTFVFVITGFVYTSFAHRHEDIDGYLDALYFTVTTLTTTGYGDILLPGAWGRILSIVTMVVGITLFVRLAQAIFRPHKVRFRCNTCGLGVHDPDAVHCKACGELLNIPNDEA
jgi:voltage-gated potassium channel